MTRHMCILCTLNSNSVDLVSERTILTERPPLVSEVSANFCGYSVTRGQRDETLRLSQVIKHVKTRINGSDNLSSEDLIEFIWPIGTSSNKLLIYKTILKPIWTYRIQL
jgi:hypothetical protein